MIYVLILTEGNHDSNARGETWRGT